MRRRDREKEEEDRRHVGTMLLRQEGDAPVESRDDTLRP